MGWLFPSILPRNQSGPSVSRQRPLYQVEPTKCYTIKMVRITWYDEVCTVKKLGALLKKNKTTIINRQTHRLSSQWILISPTPKLPSTYIDLAHIPNDTKFFLSMINRVSPKHFLLNWRIEIVVKTTRQASLASHTWRDCHFCQDHEIFCLPLLWAQTYVVLWESVYQLHVLVYYIKRLKKEREKPFKPFRVRPNETDVESSKNKLR